MKKMQILSVMAIIVVLLLVTVSIAYAHDNGNRGVIPPSGRVQGKTSGQWLARWWQYVLETPASQNPLAGGTNSCIFKRIGNVGLVVANSTLGTSIECTVPAGMKLYIEVLGAECSNLEGAPFYGGNEEELVACAKTFVPQDMEASIDGVEIQNLNRFVVLSPMYQFTNPEGNILGVSAGTIGKSVGSGAYLMITPLSPGKHSIHVQGTYLSLGYTADKTLDLTVTP